MKFKIIKESKDTKIEVENPSLLEVPEGKKVYDLPVSHFKKLIDKKGREKIIRAITNLQVWNKNDDHKIASWAKKMKKSLEGYGEKKTKNESYLCEAPDEFGIPYDSEVMAKYDKEISYNRKVRYEIEGLVYKIDRWMPKIRELISLSTWKNTFSTNFFKDGKDFRYEVSPSSVEIRSGAGHYYKYELRVSADGKKFADYYGEKDVDTVLWCYKVFVANFDDLYEKAMEYFNSNKEEKKTKNESYDTVTRYSVEYYNDKYDDIKSREFVYADSLEDVKTAMTKKHGPDVIILSAEKFEVPAEYKGFDKHLRNSIDATSKENESLKESLDEEKSAELFKETRSCIFQARGNISSLIANAKDDETARKLNPIMDQLGDIFRELRHIMKEY